MAESMRDRGYGFGGLRRLAANNSQVTFGNFRRVRCGPKAHGKTMHSRYAQSAFIQRSGVLRTPHERMDFRDAREVSRVQAADGSASDYADSF